MTELFKDGVRLVPATIEQLNLEDKSVDVLARALGVAAPPSWPPEFNDRETRAWVRERLVAQPLEYSWYSRYIIAQIDNEPVLAGVVGYKGAPDVTGQVEIGYSVVVELQRRGIAKAAVRELCIDAFHQGAETIIAHTLPTLIASQGVLRKVGFKPSQTIIDPNDGEVWQYQLQRANLI